MPIVLKKPDNTTAKYSPDFTNPNFLKNIFKAVVDAADLKFGSAGKNLIEAAFAVSKIEDTGVLAYLLINKALINSCRELVGKNEHLYKNKSLEERYKISDAFEQIYGEFQNDLEGKEITRGLFSHPEKEIDVHAFQKKLWKHLVEKEILNQTHAQNLAFQLTQIFPQKLEEEWYTGDYAKVKKALIENDDFAEARKYRLAHLAYQQKLLAEYTEVVLNDSAGMTLADIYIEPYVKVYRKCWTRHRSKSEPFRPFLIVEKNRSYKEDIHSFISKWLNTELSEEEFISHKSRITLLFGQPGQGKTSFTKRLTNDLLLPHTKFPWSKRVYLIKLRNFEKEEVTNLIANPERFLQEKLQARKPFRENPIRYEDYVRAIWILDGLDELKMKENLSSSDIKEFLEKIHRLTQNEDFDLHVLITSRQGTVDPEKLNEKDFLTIQLLGLDQRQQNLWLSTYQNFHPNHKGITHKKLHEIRTRKNFAYLKELIEQPILLHLIAKSGISPQHDINRAKIYQELFDQLIDRAWDEGQIPALKDIAQEDLREFLGDIALKIWQSPNEYITKKDLIDLAKSDSPFKFTNEDIGILLKQVMVSFYFHSVAKDERDNSDDSSRDAIEFLHKSLMEYLAAEKIWREFQHLGEKVGRKFKLQSAEEVLNYLHPTIAPKMIFDEEEKVEEYVFEIISSENHNYLYLSNRLYNILEDLVIKSFLATAKVDTLEVPILEQGRNTFYNYWNILAAVDLTFPIGKKKSSTFLFSQSIKAYATIDVFPLRIENWDLSNEELSNLQLKGAIINHTILKKSELLAVNLDDSIIYSSNFSSSSMSNLRAQSASISSSRFNDTSMTGVLFEGSILTDINFSNSSLDRSSFNNAELARIDFQSSILTSSQFEFAKLNDINFDKAYLHGTAFKGAVLNDIEFTHVNSHNLNLSLARLNNVSFNRASLIAVNLHGITLEGKIDFTNAYLDKINLHGINFSNAILEQTTIKDSFLKLVNFDGISAENVNFHSSYLFKCSFKSASLYGARFESTNLLETDFTSADLRNTNFKGAKLYLTNFQYTNLEGAKGLTYDQLAQVASLKRVQGLNSALEKKLKKEKPSLFQ